MISSTFANKQRIINNVNYIFKAYRGVSSSHLTPNNEERMMLLVFYIRNLASYMAQ